MILFLIDYAYSIKYNKLKVYSIVNYSKNITCSVFNIKYFHICIKYINWND